MLHLYGTLLRAEKPSVLRSRLTQYSTSMCENPSVVYVLLYVLRSTLYTLHLRVKSKAGLTEDPEENDDLECVDGKMCASKRRLLLFQQFTLNKRQAVMGKSQIKSQIIKSNPNNFRSKSIQITNQFYRNVKFLKMFSLHNNYRISQKSQPVCIRS